MEEEEVDLVPIFHKYYTGCHQGVEFILMKEIKEIKEMKTSFDVEPSIAKMSQSYSDIIVLFEKMRRTTVYEIDADHIYSHLEVYATFRPYLFFFLMQIGEYDAISQHILYLAFSFMDRLMSQIKKITFSPLFIALLASLRLALKLESETDLCVNFTTFIAPLRPLVCQIEYLILRRLSGYLFTPTSWHFVFRYFHYITECSTKYAGYWEFFPIVCDALDAVMLHPLSLYECPGLLALHVICIIIPSIENLLHVFFEKFGKSPGDVKLTRPEMHQHILRSQCISQMSQKRAEKCDELKVCGNHPSLNCL